MPIDFEHLSSITIIYALELAGALVVAAVGWWAAGVAQRAVRRTLRASSYIDATLANFLSSLVRYAVLIIAFLLILQVIGVQATSLIAVLGAASLAIGLALQGTLSNIAAGLMLLLFRPFRLGDQIEVAGKRGVVVDLNLFMTELAGDNEIQILVPNNQIWNTAILNHSAYKRQDVGEKPAGTPASG